MSISPEVADLRVKVAQLEKDLDYTQRQKDTADASNQALIQIVTNLSTPKENNTLPVATSQGRNRNNDRLTQVEDLQEKYVKAEQTIKELERQLTISERLRGGIASIARERQAALRACGMVDNSRFQDNGPDEEPLPGTESGFESSGRGKRTKRARAPSSSGQDDYDGDSETSSSDMPVQRGRTLIRRFSLAQINSSRDGSRSNIGPRRRKPSKSDSDVAVPPVPQFGFRPMPVREEARVPATSVQVTASRPAIVPAPDTTAANEAASQEAERIKQEKDELLKTRLEMLKQKKQLQAANTEFNNKFGKIPVSRSSPSKEITVKTFRLSFKKDASTSEKDVSLGMIMKGHPFSDSPASPTKKTMRVVLNGKDQNFHITGGPRQTYRISSPIPVSRSLSPANRNREEAFDESDVFESKRHHTERPQGHQVVGLDYDELPTFVSLEENSDEIDLGHEDATDDLPPAVSPYNNPDEIDLGLSGDETDIYGVSDDEQETRPIHITTEKPKSPVVLEFLPFEKQSDAAKALDSLPCDWENSADEDDRVTTPPQQKSNLIISDDDDEETKREKTLIAKLLGPWEDTEEPTMPLQEFAKITEEPSIYQTGIDMSYCKFYGVCYDKDENGEYPVNPGGFQMLNGKYDTFSVYAPPNDQLWGPYEDRHEALRLHREEEGHPKAFVEFFKYGLCYTPSPGERENTFRTVHLAGLPKETTIGDLMARVRGGTIVTAQILDTMKLLGSNSAQVIFAEADDATEYVRFSMEHPISFGRNHAALLTLVGTPTWPISSSMQGRLERNQTRSLAIPGFPLNWLNAQAMRSLLSDLASKRTDFDANGIACGFRTESIEEPFHDAVTGVLRLNFASIDLAGSAFGILTGKNIYRGLRPTFMDDPCAGDLQECLRPPLMTYEYQSQVYAGQTVLQRFQNTFHKAKNPSFMASLPNPPSFGFDLSSIMASPNASSASRSEDPATVVEYASKFKEEFYEKRSPMLITSSEYKELFPSSELCLDTLDRSPRQITIRKFNEFLEEKHSEKQISEVLRLFMDSESSSGNAESESSPYDAFL